MTGTSVSTPTVVARAVSYGTSDKAVSTWENGRRGPKLKTIETLAKQFDLPIDVMVNGNLEDYYNKPSSRSQSNIRGAQDYLLKLIDFQGDKSSLTYEDMLFLKRKVRINTTRAGTSVPARRLYHCKITLIEMKNPNTSFT